MDIISQFNHARQVRGVELIENPIGLTFIAPAAAAEGGRWLLSLEPGPAAEAVLHAEEGGHVHQQSEVDGSVRVTVQFNKPLIAAMLAPGNQHRALNLYRPGCELPMVELSNPTWTTRLARTLALYATAKSRLGVNHWGVDAVFVAEGQLHAYGWALAPRGWERTPPNVSINGAAAEVRVVAPMSRDLYWLVALDRLEGFHAVAPLSAPHGFARIMLEYPGDTRQDVRRLAIYQFLGHPRDDGRGPLPDLAAIHRVSGRHANETSFVNSGKSDYERFKQLIERHHGLRPDMKLLDWGVGCGRLARHFLHDGVDIYGADIDAMSVQWCNEHLAAGKFVAVDLFPPTPYADESFDVIVSSGVLSHLTESTMRSWLEEVARILKPGGRAFLSFNGDGTSYLYASASLHALDGLTRKGVFDEWRTPDLDGAVRGAENYYRLTLFRSDHARTIFSEYLSLLAVEPGVTSGHQDLAVLARCA